MSKFEKICEDNPLAIQIGGSHYKDFEYQPIEFFMDMRLNFIQCNIVKYIVRHRLKNGVEDVKKAKHYAEIGVSIDKSIRLGWPSYNSDRFASQIDGDIEQRIVLSAVRLHYADVIKLCDELIHFYEYE